jgi:DNA polymerase III delta prime subunit
MLIIFGGLPGTGKSTLALKLADQLGAMYLRNDTIEGAIGAGEDVLPVGEKKAIGWPMLSPRTISGSVSLSLRMRSMLWRSHAAPGGASRKVLA